ncbi:MAG: hypothetical protein Q9190_003928 [Brigantiaea leucoxantha]
MDSEVLYSKEHHDQKYNNESTPNYQSGFNRTQDLGKPMLSTRDDVNGRRSPRAVPSSDARVRWAMLASLAGVREDKEVLKGSAKGIEIDRGLTPSWSNPPKSPSNPSDTQERGRSKAPPVGFPIPIRSRPASIHERKKSNSRFSVTSSDHHFESTVSDPMSIEHYLKNLAKDPLIDNRGLRDGLQTLILGPENETQLEGISERTPYPAKTNENTIITDARTTPGLAASENVNEAAHLRSVRENDQRQTPDIEHEDDNTIDLQASDAFEKNSNRGKTVTNDEEPSFSNGPKLIQCGNSEHNMAQSRSNTEQRPYRRNDFRQPTSKSEKVMQENGQRGVLRPQQNTPSHLPRSPVAPRDRPASHEHRSSPSSYSNDKPGHRVAKSDPLGARIEERNTHQVEARTPETIEPPQDKASSNCAKSHLSDSKSPFVHKSAARERTQPSSNASTDPTRAHIGYTQPLPPTPQTPSLRSVQVQAREFFNYGDQQFQQRPEESFHTGSTQQIEHVSHCTMINGQHTNAVPVKGTLSSPPSAHYFAKGSTYESTTTASALKHHRSDLPEPSSPQNYSQLQSKTNQKSNLPPINQNVTSTPPPVTQQPLPFHTPNLPTPTSPITSSENKNSTTHLQAMLNTFNERNQASIDAANGSPGFMNQMISLLCKMAQDALPEIERRLAANAQASRQSQRKRNKQESEMEEESEAEEESEDNEEDKTWE